MVATEADAAGEVHQEVRPVVEEEQGDEGVQEEEQREE